MNPINGAVADVVVIGGGFAGASTAAAMARAGVTNGLLLEREGVCGSHASGRNAAIARQLEPDPILGKLALRGVQLLGEKRVEERPVLDRSGALYLIHAEKDNGAPGWIADAIRQGPGFQLLPAAEARPAFGFLDSFHFDYAVF